MKLAIISLLVLAIISSAAIPVLAVSFPQYQDKYVNDFAGIFSAGQTAQLRSLLGDVELNSTAEVVVVTIQNLSGMAPSDYATQLFNEWGVGKSSNDNGLLILYAKEENKLWATTGYGLEGILPDSKLGRLMDEYYVPQRDAGDAANGILLFTEQVAGIIEQNGGEVYSQGNIDPLNILVAIFVFVIIIGIILSSIAGSRVKCEVCGLKMKRIKTEGGGWGSDTVYYIYECPNGHKKKVKSRRNMAIFVAGGGFGGGGFGGGGFGGGASGGGGAGR